MTGVAYLYHTFPKFILQNLTFPPSAYFPPRVAELIDDYTEIYGFVLDLSL